MSSFQVIDREIAPKGKVYLVCTQYDPADFSAELKRICNAAVLRGARKLYFACRDKANDLDAQTFAVGACSFMFYSNFDLLKKPLARAQSSAPCPLHIKPLRAFSAPLFAALYNESFFDVPNAMTVTDEEIEEILADEGRDAGFFLRGGEPIGVFELRYGGDAPEIAALAIRVDLQNRGYGSQALGLLEERLAREGYDAASLLVASANERAYRLYQKSGYLFSCRVGHWYEAVAD